MNLTKPYGPRDEASGPELDSFFMGVEERLAPQQLPNGMVSRARNKRFRNGRAATREGIIMLPWMKVDGRTPFTDVYGGAVFNDPNQNGQWILVAADGGVWRTRPHYVAQQVPLPAGEVLTKGTFRKFVQANGAILLLRGLTKPILQCTNLEEGFKPILQVMSWDVTFDHATNRVVFPSHGLLVGDPVRFTVGSGPGLPVSVTANQTYFVDTTPTTDHFTISDTPGGTQVTWSLSSGDVAIDIGAVSILDGSSAIPPSEDGIFFENRVWLINGKDTIAVSDIGDFTRYLPLQDEFRINQGDSFSLVTLRVFNEDTLVCFKSGNVRKVVSASGDLSQAVGPQAVTDSYGAVAAGAVFEFGKEIYWLTSELRVGSLTLTELNQEQGTDVALSDPLEKTFARINPTYASGARMTSYNGFLFCALPLDEAEVVSDTELVASGQVYTSSIGVVVNVTAGKNYKYFQGANGGKLVNGTETLLGDANFVAQGATVTIYANVAGFVQCLDSVKQVLAAGVNTAVAVYDFLNAAWAGSDESAGVTVVVDWLQFEYGGRPRLGFIGADGWLHLYGEGYEDDKLVSQAPYVDVLADIRTVGATGGSLQVNGGNIVNGAAALVNSTIGGPVYFWGVQNADVARVNLWSDPVSGVGGFNPGGGSPWTAPNTTPSLIDYGVRFTATNGVLPQIKIDGAVVANGSVSWSFVDSHQATEIQSVPVQDWVRTRAFLCIAPGRTASMPIKRYLQMAAEIATWSPKYTVMAIVQGMGAGQVYVTDEVRDRTKYFAPFDKNAWDPSNVNDDYDAPRREDYSTVLPDTGITQGTGWTLDALQEYVHRVDVDENGLWMQLDITNADGRLELLAVAMEAEGAEMLSGPAIT